MLSSCLTGINVGMLNWWHLTCCISKALSMWKCIINNLGFFQPFTVLVCNVTLYMFYIHYCREDLINNFYEREAIREKRKDQTVLVMVISLGIILCIVVLWNFSK